MLKQSIPTIYFYLLSAVGMVLLIIGLFKTTHFLSGVMFFDKYPLQSYSETRCENMPQPVTENGKTLPLQKETMDLCLKSLEKERLATKQNDLEQSISFTIIGLLVFSTHFYFARKPQGKS